MERKWANALALALFLYYRKRTDLCLIKISKEEKFALVKKYPEIEREITRTCKQRSKRGNYYAPAVPRVIAFLNHFWDSRTIEGWREDNV
jgi:hypothetical protein